MWAYHLIYAKHVFWMFLPWNVWQQFVPKLLNFEQKQQQVDITQELLNEMKNDSELLKRVLAYDERYVYGYDIETMEVV